MSTDHSHYEAKCGVCGKVGEYIHSSDDWNNSSERWDGFQIVASPEYEVARKRTGPTRARCSCGSYDVQKGKFLRRS